MRVFHVISEFENGGVEAMITRWISHMPSDIEFHIVANGISVPECAERMQAAGAIVHLIPCRKHLFRHLHALKKLFCQYRPDIVHVHTTERAFPALFAAKEAGVPCRIQHSHAAFGETCFFKKILLNLCFRLGKATATDYFACGQAAARTAFGKTALDSGKVTVLPNGIETEKFTFSHDVRISCRKELGISDDTRAVGMAARFSPQKNHEGALHIFELYWKQHPNSCLILAGDGKLLPVVSKKAQKMFPPGVVRFLGSFEQMPAFYAAMDVFFLPSFFEGLPVSLVEAQASGLPAVVSDTVSREAALTDLVTFLPLDSPSDFVPALDRPVSTNREVYSRKVADAGFSAEKSALLLKEFYFSHRRS